jgi:ATP-dependent Lon protease
MTGEVTLTGRVLPVGGIREKVLAARRAGIHHVMLPKQNRKDLTDLPPEVQADMHFEFVDNIEDALSILFSEKTIGEKMMPEPAAKLKKTRSARSAAQVSAHSAAE